MSLGLKSAFLVLFAVEELLANHPMLISKNNEFSEFLGKTINELAIQVRAEMLLCINLNATEINQNLNWLLQHATNVPKLVVTKDNEETNYEIIRKFTSEVVTVAFVRPNISDIMRVLLKVQKLLWRSHYKDVLFVFGDTAEMADSSSRSQLLFSLFAECWKNGFTQVIALNSYKSLYTYHPFPQLRVVQLPHMLAYKIKTHLQNFQGYKLRSPISSSSPRSYHYIDRNGSVATGGYFYKIVRTFIDHYNGTFEELVMPTYDMNFRDILKAFASREIDIVANLFYMNSNYSYSYVFANFRVYVIAPFARPIPEYLYLKKPFTSHLWGLILTTIVYLVPIITWINWRQHSVLDLSGTFLEVLKTILFLPQHRRMQTRIQIFIFIMLLLTGFLLTNFYLAKLSSLLATKVYGQQINTFDDIANTQLLLPQTELDLNYLRALSRIHPSVLDRIWLTSPEVVYNLRRDLNTSFLHSGVEDKINFFLYQQKFLKVPYFQKIDQILYVLPVFIPMPHRSPFIAQLNYFLRRIVDTGIMNKIMNDNEQDGILSGEIRFYRSQSSDGHTLTVEHLMLALLILGVGLTTASAFLLLEIIIKRYKRKTNFYAGTALKKINKL